MKITYTLPEKSDFENCHVNLFYVVSWNNNNTYIFLFFTLFIFHFVQMQNSKENPTQLSYQYNKNKSSKKMGWFLLLSKTYRLCKQLMVLRLWLLLKWKSFINDVDADNGWYFIVCSVDNQNQGNLILKTKNQNFRA